MSEIVTVTQFTTPPLGKIELLRGVFNPGLLEQSLEELDENPTELTRHSNFRSEGLVEFVDRTRQLGLTATATCIDALSKIADTTENNPEFTSLLREVKTLKGSTLHRDSVEPCLSLLVVMRGSAEYAYNGYRIGNEIHLKADRCTAVAGDVLAINQLTVKHHRHPLHKVIRANGIRHIYNFIP